MDLYSDFSSGFIFEGIIEEIREDSFVEFAMIFWILRGD